MKKHHSRTWEEFFQHHKKLQATLAETKRRIAILEKENDALDAELDQMEAEYEKTLKA